jgi:hypothetical protein
MAKEEQQLRAWVVTVDMGLGHQRAAYPFADIAEGGILDVGADPEERRQWRRLQRSYETLSRIRSVPVVGKPLFGVIDTIQNIPPFYPLRDMSRPSFQVKLISSLIERGMGKGMVEKIATKPLPLLTSYPVPALAADRAGYPRIYAVVCDAEISRAWVAEDPMSSRIQYLAPCGRAVMRLRSYGVPDERIFLTGFPMPHEALGGRRLETLRTDMGRRLHSLDPNNRFWPLHERGVVHFLGRQNSRPRNEPVLTITYAVGGAGAQKEIGWALLQSLRDRLKAGTVKLNLVAGVRPEVRDYFQDAVSQVLPGSPSVNIIFREEKSAYFGAFAATMRTTDILWTKPSELSFYCGLGIPIIMAPTIGSQEIYNRRWLLEVQAGIDQEDPAYAHQWLFDLLNAGRLAEAAWDGFLKARKFGTFKILDVLETGAMQRETSVLKR